MLLSIRVQNIALMDEVEVNLTDGLNIITGETGAGKSILLGAINIALSAKAAKEVVRDETKEAFVELLFEDDSAKVTDYLKENDLPYEDGQILISRRFAANGRGSSRINGITVLSSQVKALASLLIDIHGQHEHQSLLNQATHIDLLDKFSSESVQLRPEVKALWDELLALEKEQEKYAFDDAEKERRLALLRFECDEIEAADLVEGEEEELLDTRKRLVYAERLRDSAYKAYVGLNGDSSSYDASGAISLMENAISFLEDSARLDGEFFNPCVETLREAVSIATDCAGELRNYADHVEDDPQLLAEVEDRLNLIDKMRTKYGRTIAEIYQYKLKNDAEIESLSNLADTKARLARQKESLMEKISVKAGALSEARQKVAVIVSQKITDILSTLQFNDPEFQITVNPTELNAKGVDDVCFMIRTNHGEALKPLGKIASGGEISRIMLAIKTVLAQQDEIHTLIFDEIDTGISGRTAQSVAEKMSLIARYRQVIAVTHLPQLASMADHHMMIEKHEEDGHTVTCVHELSDREQIDEIARLLGGREITAAVVENASEMKALANAWKEEARR